MGIVAMHSHTVHNYYVIVFGLFPLVKGYLLSYKFLKYRKITPKLKLLLL